MYVKGVPANEVCRSFTCLCMYKPLGGSTLYPNISRLLFIIKFITYSIFTIFFEI